MTSNLSQPDLLAEETHSGRIWTLLILPAMVGPAISVALVPTGPARIALVIVAVVGTGALAMVWSGFQYRFLRDRVEHHAGRDTRRDPRRSVLPGLAGIARAPGKTR